MLTHLEAVLGIRAYVKSILIEIFRRHPSLLDGASPPHPPTPHPPSVFLRLCLSVFLLFVFVFLCAHFCRNLSMCLPPFSPSLSARLLNLHLSIYVSVLLPSIRVYPFDLICHYLSKCLPPFSLFLSARSLKALFNYLCSCLSSASICVCPFA